MRMRLAVALLLVASAADAAQIILKYKPPFYLDDTIPFSITTPYPVTRVTRTEEPVNLTIEDWGTRMVGAAQEHWFLARPIAGGPARIPPYTFPGTSGNETVPPMPLNVLPVNQSDNPDSMAILQKMRESGRPPVVVIVSVRPQPAYAGELVQITWEMVSDADAYVTLPEPPKIEGVVDFPFGNYGTTLTAAAGKIVRSRPLRRITFVPEQAGTITIPTAKLEGTYEATGIREPFYRMTPRQSVMILPVPGNLPFGTYTLRASKPSVDRNVTMSIDITGPGDAGITHPPDLGNVPGTYLLKPGRLKASIDPATQQPVATRTWSIELHPREQAFDIPTVSFTSWAPALQHAVTVQGPVNVTVPAKDDAPKTSSTTEALHNAPPEGINRALMVFGIIDLLLLIALLVTNSVCSV